ncbi:ankyrin repeat domain-containing protein [Flavobacterium johnsoniae]|uniref:ankyrin repeat domain-containing protein n=1 Tax=Flavobacterium johnsoniae TaxID=986 RepID=UPI0025B24C11|nr:ankyrin repeat domain-containing protein [Flavobacterium johnsoniae]WJS96730.1 ankyrin repeat domain-containing protein [Flavobacterium johnsoniae]
MKKSVIILGVALLSLGNVAMASNGVSSLENKVERTKIYTSPLTVAISKGDLETVKKFIEYGVDVNQMSEDLSPLMMAARYNKVEIIKVLLANGARANDKNERGLTALKYAELSNAKDAIAILKSL